MQQAGGPPPLIVRDQQGHTFGGFASEPWHPSPSYYGNGECFLFKAQPEQLEQLDDGRVALSAAEVERINGLLPPAVRVFPSATCGCRTPPACGRGCQPAVGPAPRTCVPDAAATPAVTGFFESMPGFAGQMAGAPPSAAATRGGDSVHTPARATRRGSGAAATRGGASVRLGGFGTARARMM